MLTIQRNNNKNRSSEYQTKINSNYKQIEKLTHLLTVVKLMSAPDCISSFTISTLPLSHAK